MRGRALVARNLSQVRVKRGLSQERLGFDSSMDRSYVGGLERQEENPTVDLLDRLARTLSIHISELLIEPARGATPLRRGRRRSDCRTDHGWVSTRSRRPAFAKLLLGRLPALSKRTSASLSQACADRPSFNQVAQALEGA